MPIETDKTLFTDLADRKLQKVKRSLNSSRDHENEMKPTSVPSALSINNTLQFKIVQLDDS